MEEIEKVITHTPKLLRSGKEVRMAPTTNEAELTRLKGKLNALKTGYNEFGATCQQLMTKEKEAEWPFLIRRLEENWSIANDMGVQIRQVYTEVLANPLVSSSEETTEEWKKSLKAFKDKANQLETQVCEIAVRSERDLNISTSLMSQKRGPGRDDTSKITVKPVECLKPWVLKSNDSPQNVRSWKKKMTSYLTISKILELPNAQQIAFVNSNISEDILERLQTKLKSTDGAMKALQIIQDDFLDRYPLVNRRLDFFKTKMYEDETFDNYLTRLKSLGVEGDIDKMTSDQIYVFVALNSVSDNRLREWLLKLQNPTLEQLRSEAHKYESTVAQEKKLDKTVKVMRVFEYPKKKRWKSKVKNRNRSLSAERKPDRSCWTCGKKGHMRNECEANKEDLYCNFCEMKKSHSTKACWKRDENRPKQKYRSPSPNRARSETSEASSSSDEDEDDDSKDDDRTRKVTCRVIREISDK